MTKAITGYLNNLVSGNKAKSTIVAYNNDLMRFYKFLYDKYPSMLNNLENIKPIHLIDYRDCMRIIDGYSPHTIDRKMSSLREFFEYMEMVDLISHNPALKIKHKKHESTKLPTYLPWEDISLMIDMAAMDRNANWIRNAALLCVYAYTGCRRSEAINLDWGDVDLVNKTLKIRRDKSRNADVLPMHQCLQQWLKALYEISDTHPNQPVFVSSEGNRISVTAVKQMVTKYARYSNLPSNIKVTPHIYRHSFVTNALQAGMSIPEIQLYTGHRDMSSLMPYIHLTTQDKMRMIENMPV